MLSSNFLKVILIICVFRVLSGEALAGTPHTAYGKIFNSDGTVPDNGDIAFNAYILTRPGEVLMHSSTGCSYSSGYWSVAVGNFSTAWAVGDILHVDVTNTLNGETNSVDVTMTSAGSDVAPDLHLNPVVPVELSSFKVLMEQKRIILTWTTETESNNLGFEIFKKQNSDNFHKLGFVLGHGTTTMRHNYSYEDDQLVNGTYYYQLKQIDLDGTFELSEIKSVTVSLLSGFGLEKIYPNPFNLETMIHYQVSEGGPTNVELRIYNSLGELVRTLINEQQSPGKYFVIWDGRDDHGNMMSSGIYINHLITKDHISNLKMIYMK